MYLERDEWYRTKRETIVAARCPKRIRGNKETKGLARAF